MRIQDDRLYHFEKWNLLTPPPISGTKTSRKLEKLKLFPTPFKLMGSGSHRLMFVQFNMSFYHTPWKMNSWNLNSWRFASDDFPFRCHFLGSMQFMFRAFSQPPHLPTLMIFLICSGGLNNLVPGCRWFSLTKKTPPETDKLYPGSSRKK